jgi:hypothetical protein
MYKTLSLSILSEGWNNTSQATSALYLGFPTEANPLYPINMSLSNNVSHQDITAAGLSEADQNVNNSVEDIQPQGCRTQGESL